MRKVPDWTHRGEYIAERLKQVSEESEARRHEPLPDDAVATYDTSDRPRIVSVRVSRDQYRLLEAYAAEKNLPVSTAARSLILDGITHAPSDFEAAIRNTIKPEFLRAS